MVPGRRQKRHSMSFLRRERLKLLAMHAAEGYSLKIFNNETLLDCFTTVRNDDETFA